MNSGCFSTTILPYFLNPSCIIETHFANCCCILWIVLQFLLQKPKKATPVTKRTNCIKYILQLVICDVNYRCNKSGARDDIYFGTWRTSASASLTSSKSTGARRTQLSSFSQWMRRSRSVGARGGSSRSLGLGSTANGLVVL